MLTKDEKNLIAFAIGLCIGGGTCFAFAADLTIDEQVKVSGPVKLVDSYLEFPDGTRFTSAIVPDTSAIWGQISGLIVNQTDLNSALLLKQDTSAKGQPSGYASLGADGKVPADQLPPFAPGATVFVNSFVLGSENFTSTWFTQGNIWTEFEPSFSIDFVKSSSDSLLSIYWADNVGIFNPSWCNIGLFLDDSIEPFCGGAWSGVSGNTVFYQQHLHCSLDSVPAGSHIIKVKHRSQYCMYGNYAFDNSGLQRVLIVEE